MRSERPSKWKATYRGWWRHVEDGEGVTVFETTDLGWKWVYDGEFSGEFNTYQEAMMDAENDLDLEPA